MSNFRDPQPANEPKVDLTSPNIIGVLDPVSGGEENLLPKDAWLVPLRIEFELWSDSAPESGMVDTVQLFWKGEKVDEKRLSGPVQETDLWLSVPSSKLDEGVHALYYQVKPWNGSSDRQCVPVSVTVDKTAPILAADSKLIFPIEVRPPNEITAAYLDNPANGDRVLVTLPDYNEVKVGDVITWYWEISPGGQDVADIWSLELGDIGTVLQLPFSGDLLRRSNNGTRYATYRVRDRAGNDSLLSTPAQLTVNIRPPTPRKFPTVKQATNSPTGTGILNPFNGGAGVTVEVQASEVDPGDEVTVDFIGLGGEDGIGSIKGVRPISAGGLEFAIPAAVVAANIRVDAADRRTVEVYYWIGNAPQHSAIYTLTINPFAVDALGQVQCRQAQVGAPATISKVQVPTGGADLDIEKWIYQARGQRMNVWAMAGGVQTDFLRGEPHGVDGTFNTKIAKDFVDRQALNSTFTLCASVSFDLGQSYIGFKSLALKVVA